MPDINNPFYDENQWQQDAFGDAFQDRPYQDPFRTFIDGFRRAGERSRQQQYEREQDAKRKQPGYYNTWKMTPEGQMRAASRPKPICRVTLYSNDKRDWKERKKDAQLIETVACEDDIYFEVPRGTPKQRIEVRPNAPCPCGSGKKAKKCCGCGPKYYLIKVPRELEPGKAYIVNERIWHAKQDGSADWPYKVTAEEFEAIKKAASSEQS